MKRDEPDLVGDGLHGHHHDGLHGRERRGGRGDHETEPK